MLRGWLTQMNVRRATHRLRVDEFASLGEKRFVAVVHFENERFLIGGAGSQVNLLSKLSRGSTTNFASTINACLEKGK
jgi:flagellar biogenesis protein FliO